MATALASPSLTRRHDSRAFLDALAGSALRATRAAALACQPLVGSGDPHAADAAATAAMRSALAAAPGDGTVVIGEGEKDAAPMLFNGEPVGNGHGSPFDVAVDPLECTDLCARGLAGALTTIAIAEAGSLWSPGPAHYMDKLVAGPAARDAIDLREEPEANVKAIAKALGRRPAELRILVLDKPRHGELIARLRATGARVQTPPAGDVAGALLAVLPGSGVDALMGIGGTPEGVLAACAVASLGGEMQTRLAPQRQAEREQVAAAGLDVARVLTTAELVTGSAMLAATGVTGGELLRPPWDRHGATFTESLLVTPRMARWVIECANGDAPSTFRMQATHTSQEG